MDFAFYLNGELGAAGVPPLEDHTEDLKGCQSQAEMSYI